MVPKKKLLSLLSKTCAKLVVSLLVVAVVVKSSYAINDNQILPAIVYPVVAPKFTSSFGVRKHPVLKVKKHHHGVDLSAPIGAPIRAVSAGQVVFADPYSAYGNLIVIQHANGLTSHYGHCSEIKTKIGQAVKAGDIIGTIGKTGRVTGPHLHFEMRKNGQALDPEKYLPALRLPAEG